MKVKLLGYVLAKKPEMHPFAMALTSNCKYLAASNLIKKQ